MARRESRDSKCIIVPGIKGQTIRLNDGFYINVNLKSNRFFLFF
jgi:hypothetical protein